MSATKIMTLHNEKGFALLAAIIACMILLAVGMLAIGTSTGDLRSSSLTVGTRKAQAAVESGIHLLVINNDTLPLVKHDLLSIQATWTTGPWPMGNGYTTCAVASPSYTWSSIALGTDSYTEFAICVPEVARDASNNPLPHIPLHGYSDYGLAPFTASITGRSRRYTDYTGNFTANTVDVGIGVFVYTGTGSGTTY